MPTRAPRYVYWDSCIFLAYLNAEVGRVDEIQALWDEIADDPTGKSRIVTASVSIVEVAHAGKEKQLKKIDPLAEQQLDAMWHDPSVLLIETFPQILYLARSIIRSGTALGQSIKPIDAIHLATASWVHRHVQPIAELHTYDRQLFGCSALIDSIPIVEPKPFNPVQISIPET